MGRRPNTTEQCAECGKTQPGGWMVWCDPDHPSYDSWFYCSGTCYHTAVDSGRWDDHMLAERLTA